MDRLGDWLLTQGVSTVLLGVMIVGLWKGAIWWGKNFWIPTRDALVTHLAVSDQENMKQTRAMEDQSRAMKSQARAFKAQTTLISDLSEKIKKREA